MSISQNFPDEGPSLNLNFASSRTLDPRITFTRTSTGTYTNKNGLVTIAPTDTPRFDHSYNGSNVESLGLLIEESRTNLITYSEQFDNAAWSVGFIRTGITTNTSATTAPDGTNTAEKLREDTTASNSHYIARTFSGLTSTTSYTFSVFAKKAERSVIVIGSWDGVSGLDTTFDINSGTITFTPVGVTASITQYPNGWYRCVTTRTVAQTTVQPVIYLVQDGSTSYTGDGTSGVYIWGAQLEAGAFPTSYIPTVASTVTRSADNASMTGTNFSSWYNSTAATGGTISVQARRGYSGNFSGYPNIYEIGDGTSNNRIIVYGIVNSTEYTLNIVIGGVSQLDYVFDTISTTNLFKTINSFATNSATLCFNGSLKTTDTSVTLPAANRLFIGCVNGFGNLWNGTISSLSYYPTRLTNSQLQNLTK